MGNATNRQRRLKKARERQRHRAAGGGPGSRPSSGLRHEAPEPAAADVAGAAITDTLNALGAGRQDVFETRIQDLSSGSARFPDWTRTVSRLLVSLCMAVVTDAWHRGWQPAELMRFVRRQSGDGMARIAADMIAAEMRGYAAATVDDRWRAQLAELAGETWWGNDDGGYLDLRRARDGATQEQLLTAMFDLVQLLRTLPALPPLCPLPGTETRAAARARASAGADERILAKIRSLLAKAESTEFADEAEALSARAQELMAKYRIDHALLAAQAGRKDEPVGRRLPVDNPYEAPKAHLLQQVAAANRCSTVWHKHLGMSTVIGFAADAEAVELLFTSLLVQADGAMLREGAKRDRYGRSRTRAFRQSFLTSYAVRIGERLTHTSDQVEDHAIAQSPDRNLLPVLAARHQAVEDAVADMFGDRVVARNVGRATDAEGWHSGRAAADLATLQGHRALGSHSS